VWVMANKAITKEARRAARVAAAVAQEELARRTRANVEDLATFFSARSRADAVDGWLAERQQVLLEQAAQRRAEQRVARGRALRAMRDRGQTLREIARMASIPIALDSPLSEERCIELQQLWLVELLKPLFAEPRNHVRVGIVFPVLLRWSRPAMLLRLRATRRGTELLCVSRD
jgi:hypothetical protein